MQSDTAVLTDDEAAAFRTLDAGQISDAMELLELRRSVIVGLRYLGPEAVLVGTAVTIRQGSKHAPATKSDRLVRHGELAAKTALPGQVICMDVAGRVDVGSWGESHSLKCIKRGVAGLVTNGAVRDVRAIRKSGFALFCAGFSPIKSQWDLKTVAIGEPITIGEVRINPSDIVFGDEDGVVVIPYARRTAVLEKALEIRRKEQAGR